MKRIGMIAAALVAAAGIAHAGALLVNGAGATFPFPLYSKWISEYNKAHAGLQLNYQSIGSGGGIKQITEKTVDFGASDAPMTDAELAKAPGILHVPTVLGAVVVVFNGAPEGVKLTPDIVSEIFLGKITRWNDPKILAVNSVKLPELAITVAHRSDGSGTTALFTGYLAKVSPAGRTAVGSGKSVKWPVGLGGKGNEGVTGIVKTTPGAIGYVELVYAKQNKLPMATLRNADGEWVAPSMEGTSAAAAAGRMPAGFRVSSRNAKGRVGYPISSYT